MPVTPCLSTKPSRTFPANAHKPVWNNFYQTTSKIQAAPCGNSADCNETSRPLLNALFDPARYCQHTTDNPRVKSLLLAPNDDKDHLKHFRPIAEVRNSHHGLA